jgi:hypothetical protein
MWFISNHKRFDKDVEIVEKYNPGYKDDLLKLAKEDIKKATHKLRVDSNYPITQCKKYIINLLENYKELT